MTADLARLRQSWPDWDPEALKRIHGSKQRLLQAMPLWTGPDTDAARAFELIDNWTESVVFNVLRQQREHLRLHPDATAAEVIEAVDPVTGYLKREAR